jgi:hypothetical protein
MTADTLKQNPKLIPLHTKLLEHGGNFAVLPVVEDDLDKLMEKGAILTFPVKLKKMAACACHRNAADLYRKNRRRYRIATGYGLSDDGLWRQHSWAIDTYEKCIVETTTERLKYFGFVMDKAECEEFEFNNY